MHFDLDYVEQARLGAVVEDVLPRFERAVGGLAAQANPGAVFHGDAGDATAAVLVAIRQADDGLSQLRAPR
jgi:hypothetical protein